MKDETETIIRRVLGGHAEVDCVALFGSRARGRATARSDVDLYVRLVPGSRWSLRKQLELSGELTRCLGREVDLVVEDDRTSVILRRQVAAHGRPVYEARGRAWADLRVAAILAYVDLEPRLRSMGAAVRAAARAKT